jgi:1-acyl-sn-glycerol-3-phosphate acyltransferase
VALTELGLYKFLGENPERTWPVARMLATPITQLIAPSWAYGTDRMPKAGGAVVAANHFSEVDPAVLGVNSLRTLYYMAKVELLVVPIVGEILRWTGAFAVRRGEGDRDALRVARWAAREGHVVGMFAEGTRQSFGYPGPMHPGAAMVAIQEEVPIVPCGIDTFGWSLKNRRDCCVVWGNPISLEGLPRSGAGYKEGAAIVEQEITRLWRMAAQAVADGFPPALPDGATRSRPTPRNFITHPELEPWPGEPWAEGPLGPVFKPVQNSHSGLTDPLRKLPTRR